MARYIDAEAVRCNWCYFDNGDRKEIISWYEYEDCIVFYIEDKCYMFKTRAFHLDEDLEVDRLSRVRFPRVINSAFYEFRFKTSAENPITYSDTLNEDYWIVAPIKKIELLVKERE